MPPPPLTIRKIRFKMWSNRGQGGMGLPDRLGDWTGRRRPVYGNGPECDEPSSAARVGIV